MEGAGEFVGDGFGVGAGTSVGAGEAVVEGVGAVVGTGAGTGDAAGVVMGVTVEVALAEIDGKGVCVIVAVQPVSSNAGIIKTASAPGKIFFFIINLSALLVFRDFH